MWLAAATFAPLVLFTLPPTSCSHGAISSHSHVTAEQQDASGSPDASERESGPDGGEAHERPQPALSGGGNAADSEKAAARRGLATVRGLVVDSDGDPLEAVLVTIQQLGEDRSAGLATISDRSTGTFRLELPPGRWRLYFHRIGYRPVTVRLVIRSEEPVPRLHIRLRDAPGTETPVTLAMASPEG